MVLSFGYAGTKVPIEILLKVARTRAQSLDGVAKFLFKRGTLLYLMIQPLTRKRNKAYMAVGRVKRDSRMIFTSADIFYF